MVSPLKDPVDWVLDPVTDCFTREVAERISRIELHPIARARVADLADRCGKGELSEDEQSKYQEYVELIDLLGILQAKAQQRALR